MDRRRACPSRSAAVVASIFILLVWNAVENAQSRPQDQVGYLSANSGENLAGQPRAILVIAPIAAIIPFRRQHFIEQIAMTLLDIDEIEPGSARQLCRSDIVRYEFAKPAIAEH